MFSLFEECSAESALVLVYYLRFLSCLLLYPICWTYSPSCSFLGCYYPYVQPQSCPLFLFDFSEWECVALALESTPIRWDITAIKFSLVCYDVATHCPLIASFLLVLTDTKPHRDRSLRWWVSPFTYEDLRFSHRSCCFCCIGCWMGCACRLCVMCIIMASIRSIAAHIVSILGSTLDNCRACSSTSSTADCRPLWVCLLTAAEAPETCWCVLAIFLMRVKIGNFSKLCFC